MAAGSWEERWSGRRSGSLLSRDGLHQWKQGSESRKEEGSGESWRLCGGVGHERTKEETA